LTDLEPSIEALNAGEGERLVSYTLFNLKLIEAQKCGEQLATTASQGLNISCGYTLGLYIGLAIKVGSPSFGVMATLSFAPFETQEDATDE
jgi:hypothetical protein